MSYIFKVKNMMSFASLLFEAKQRLMDDNLWQRIFCVYIFICDVYFRDEVVFNSEK